jgi:hypothetical protein
MVGMLDRGGVGMGQEGTLLLGFLGRPPAGSGSALGGKLPKMIAPKLSHRAAATLAPHNGCWCHALLLDEVID